MTKQVLLGISGLQFMDDDTPEPVEIWTVADYYFRNDTHYLLYEEPVEGSSQSVKTTLKIRKKCVEILKKGPVQVHMAFEQGKTNTTHYDTPYGNIPVGISTDEIHMTADEHDIHVELSYSLDLGGDFLADSKVTLHVKSKDAPDYFDGMTKSVFST